MEKYCDLVKLSFRFSQGRGPGPAPEQGGLPLLQGLVTWREPEKAVFEEGASRAVLWLWDLQMNQALWPKCRLWAL